MNNLRLENVLLLPLLLLLAATFFFILSALIMVTYNNSIVKMNPLWKKIEYTDAMVFTLFLMFAGSVFSPKLCTKCKDKY